MAFVRVSFLISAGLVVLAAPVAAQEAPPPPLPPTSYAAPAPASTSPSAGLSVAAPVSAPPACTCGNKHGVSRWWWHRTRCKRDLQECAIGYPEEFNEWPLGQALYAQGRTQVDNGIAARMVFYDYDFEQGSGKLNLKGRDKLNDVIARLPTTFFPVIIERTPQTPALEVARQTTVLEELAKGPFPVPPQRVVVGRPISNGLSGQESPLIYANLLGQTAARGGFGGSPVGGVGLDASGLSGSAIATPGR